MKYSVLLALALLSSCRLAHPRYLRDEDLMRRNTARIMQQAARTERRARRFVRAAPGPRRIRVK